MNRKTTKKHQQRRTHRSAPGGALVRPRHRGRLLRRPAGLDHPEPLQGHLRLGHPPHKAAVRVRHPEPYRAAAEGRRRGAGRRPGEEPRVLPDGGRLRERPRGPRIISATLIK